MVVDKSKISVDFGNEGKQVVKDGSSSLAMYVVSEVEGQKNNGCSFPVGPSWSTTPGNGYYQGKSFNNGGKKKCYGCGYLCPRYAFNKHAKQCRHRDNWIKNMNAGDYHA